VKNRRFAAIALAVALPFSVATTGVAQATGSHPPRGDEGCTPGYWKNHLGAWDRWSPTTKLSAVFNLGGALGNSTFLQALNFDGGETIDGATRILLRAAVAALLNAADSGVDYSLYVREVRNRVNNALASNDRQTIINLAENLDVRNRGGCPL